MDTPRQRKRDRVKGFFKNVFSSSRDSSPALSRTSSHVLVGGGVGLASAGIEAPVLGPLNDHPFLRQTQSHPENIGSAHDNEVPIVTSELQGTAPIVPEIAGAVMCVVSTFFIPSILTNSNAFSLDHTLEQSQAMAEDPPAATSPGFEHGEQGTNVAQVGRADLAKPAQAETHGKEAVEYDPQASTAQFEQGLATKIHEGIDPSDRAQGVTAALAGGLKADPDPETTTVQGKPALATKIYEGIKTTLRTIEKTTDFFPPVKSAAAALITICDTIDVSPPATWCERRR